MTRRLAAALLLLLLGCDDPSSSDPSRLITDIGPEALRMEALAFADEFLALLDEGGAERSYPLLADFLKTEIDAPKWVSTIGTLRAAAGQRGERTRLGYGYTKTLEGAPRGSYFIIQYKTIFDRVPWTERVVVGRGGDTWNVAGYAFTK